MELARPWPLALKARPALGRMGSDELNAGKTNPFMSKELFNYVWLINPNPSIPLTIYLFNQVSCTHHAAVCGWWWRKRKRWRERQRGLQNNPFGGSTAEAEVKRTAFLFYLQFSKCTQHMSSCGPAVANIQRSENSLPWEISSREPALVCEHTGFFFFFTSFMGKGKFKDTLPCVEKRLPGRLTQLPFIASDKRLNHTLHRLKCLLVIRSRILLSLLPLADCSWSKPNDGVSAIGSAGWVNLPIGMAICQGPEPC